MRYKKNQRPGGGGRRKMNTGDTAIKSEVLNEREKQFVTTYMITGNGTKAVLDAGYNTRAPSR